MNQNSKLITIYGYFSIVCIIGKIYYAKADTVQKRKKKSIN